MTDYLTVVKEKRDEQVELIKRWKVDSDLLYLSKYVMKGPDGTSKVPDVINVTLSLPGRFANDVISMLGTAKEQAIVESEDKNLDTTFIEDFRTAAFAAASARLRWDLNPWWDFHSCIRGGCAARCMFQIVDGILVPEITPWDIGYVTYVEGVEDLDWAAYETTRSKDEIETQYKDELAQYKVSITKTGDVLDVWHKEGNEVWVNKKKILEQEHTYGYTPVVIRKATIGSMLADRDSLEHQGESIFFLIREAIPELNRLVSIMQTLNFISLKPPAGWGSKEGQASKAPEYDDVMAPGSLTPHDIGGGVTDINFGDAQRSAQLAYAIMERGIREATVAASDLGVIESPPASGVRAMIAGENRDQLLSPRLGVKALMNQDLADMFTEQVIKIGGSVELGTTRHKRTFQTSKLGGQYEAYYKYTIKSAAVDAGRASLAAAYGNLIPDRAKRVEILQREDPDGDERQLRAEEIERLIPPIKMNRDIRALLELAEKGDKYAELEAEIASNYMGMTLEQMLSGQVAPQEAEPEQEPKQVLSLFGGAGGRSQPVPSEGE